MYHVLPWALRNAGASHAILQAITIDDTSGIFVMFGTLVGVAVVSHVVGGRVIWPWAVKRNLVEPMHHRDDPVPAPPVHWCAAHERWQDEADDHDMHIHVKLIKQILAEANGVAVDGPVDRRQSSWEMGLRKFGSLRLESAPRGENAPAAEQPPGKKRSSAVRSAAVHPI